jgi:hypothetical protein
VLSIRSERRLEHVDVNMLRELLGRYEVFDEFDDGADVDGDGKKLYVDNSEMVTKNATRSMLEWAVEMSKSRASESKLLV